ncbi:MAG: Bax inhibitor-1/YccA family protein, partial [Anaerolineae bacterium]|nr:Bax inhibitor-1/YccA family protein [Anaerolineae bacterium]
MGNYNWDNNNSGGFTFLQDRALPMVDVRPLMRLVYLWMAIGLLVTAGVSFAVANSQQLVQMAASLWLPLIIVQFVVVFAMMWAMRRVSPTLVTGLFLFYAALEGLIFGVIFFALVETGQGLAIAKAFFSTAGLFGAMTVIGYTTKIDLTKFGSFLFMALIGLVIAMVVNIFLASTMLDFIISVVGVLLFTALTAYDTQKIKNLAAEEAFQQYNNETAKLAIMG